MTIEKALTIAGWMQPIELEWLATQAASHRFIAEIGSWRGRSTRALVENTSGIVYAVDTWKGSVETDNDPDFVANGGNPDWLLEDFTRNMQPLSNFIIVRQTSLEASALLGHLRFDMIFVDAAHDYENAKADILAWRPLLAEGGLLCGHDYSDWYASGISVKRAVNEVIPKVGIGPHSIWYSINA